ncbi:hypothetical protein FIBSPDRAFT_130760 [Athelia psychrophila]|uniref:Uncharacterized protein n=1 Tax=Athelia psychrophila TaxID=1759441 RepID=A0A167SP29_9AGAM|nr:hypothetical protein FIBSPDRAFT_130760 [Fibularhizoctonia sp. CBS 109695]
MWQACGETASPFTKPAFAAGLPTLSLSYSASPRVSTRTLLPSFEHACEQRALRQLQCGCQNLILQVHPVGRRADLEFGNIQAFIKISFTRGMHFNLSWNNASLGLTTNLDRSLCPRS